MALLTGIGSFGLTACASDASATRDAANGVSANAEKLHQEVLSVRSRNPASTGAPAIQAILERSGFSAGRGSTGPNGETVWVLPVTARVSSGEWLSSYEAVLGGCLRVTATVGRADGKVGERGQVTSEPVPCPAGMTLENYGRTAKEMDIGIDTLRDDVPAAPYEPPPCLSGQPENCVGG